MNTEKGRIFVALDTTDNDAARALACAGLPLFLDLKFHDIPNTGAAAVQLRPKILNVHAAAGPAMMRAAAARATAAALG